MLKPIVSMNQMAMNESIATTCCYVWNGNSILGSASLPHGGTLVGNKNSTKWYVNGKELNGTWVSWQGGHVTTKGADAGVAGCVVTKSMQNVLGYHSHVGTNGFSSMDEGKAAGFIEFTTCNHSDADRAAGYCPYVKVTGGYNGTFTHTGATSAHYDRTSGNSWLVDHDAVQFSS